MDLETSCFLQNTRINVFYKMVNKTGIEIHRQTDSFVKMLHIYILLFYYDSDYSVYNLKPKLLLIKCVYLNYAIFSQCVMSYFRVQ